MESKNTCKSQRRKLVDEFLKENIFATDDELAQLFQVSVQTIRLDRAALNIPELRERIKLAAEQNTTQVRSISGGEIIGDLVELKLNETGMSLLVVTKDMVLDKTKIIRGHFLFAQANSLAVAIVDSPLALTGSAQVKYQSPVKLGEKVVCRAIMQKQIRDKIYIRVNSTVNNEVVFTGDFLIFAKQREEI